MFEAHPNMEPVKHVLRFGRHLPLHRPEPYVTVGQHRNLRLLIHSQRFEPVADLTHPALVFIRGEGEARAFPLLSQQLAGRDFKIALIRLAASHISSIQTDHHRLRRRGPRAYGRLGLVPQESATHTPGPVAHSHGIGGSRGRQHLIEELRHSSEGQQRRQFGVQVPQLEPWRTCA